MSDKGNVKWFNNDKGFGFITPMTGPDVFVHFSDIQMDGYKTLRADDQVEFDLIPDAKGCRAIHVRVIESEPV